jgi:hypothetical protein
MGCLCRTSRLSTCCSTIEAAMAAFGEELAAGMIARAARPGSDLPPFALLKRAADDNVAPRQEEYRSPRSGQAIPHPPPVLALKLKALKNKS